jgi:hypothetical protein
VRELCSHPPTPRLPAALAFAAAFSFAFAGIAFALLGRNPLVPLLRICSALHAASTLHGTTLLSAVRAENPAVCIDRHVRTASAPAAAATAPTAAPTAAPTEFIAPRRRPRVAKFALFAAAAAAEEMIKASLCVVIRSFLI